MNSLSAQGRGDVVFAGELVEALLQPPCGYSNQPYIIMAAAPHLTLTRSLVAGTLFLATLGSWIHSTGFGRRAYAGVWCLFSRFRSGGRDKAT